MLVLSLIWFCYQFCYQVCFVADILFASVFLELIPYHPVTCACGRIMGTYSLVSLYFVIQFLCCLLFATFADEEKKVGIFVISYKIFLKLPTPQFIPLNLSFISSGLFLWLIYCTVYMFWSNWESAWHVRDIVRASMSIPWNQPGTEKDASLEHQRWLFSVQSVHHKWTNITSKRICIGL